MTLRRGESLLLALGIPVLLLAFFSEVDVLPVGTRHPVTFLAPGILALAVMSTAMVSLGIATAFERSYGVLKRLGTTPLGRPALLAAKTAAILVVEVVQVAVLVPVALALGWDPWPSAHTWRRSCQRPHREPRTVPPPPPAAASARWRRRRGGRRASCPSPGPISA